MKNKHHFIFTSLAAATIPITHVARGQDFYLSLDGLVAYYDFEQTGTAGIANKAPGFAGLHDGTYLGTVSSIAGAGAGFSGDAAYPGAVAINTTDRPTCW